MPIIKKTGLLLWLTLSYGLILAFPVKDTAIVDYSSVKQCISQKVAQYGADNVLIVFDIDNTILTSHIDLGGDIWYQWQTGELEPRPTREQKISDAYLYSGAIGLLYELGTMDLTDTLLPMYLHNWQQAGIQLIALTSRSPHYRHAAERELDKFAIDFSQSPLKDIEGNKPVYIYKLKRDMSYLNGIMMTTGMHKGEMLSHLLGRTGRSFKAIIFVDDSRKNIEAVKQTFGHIPELDLSLFHYQKVIADRKKKNGGPILTEDQVEKMAKDWELLEQTLNTIFTGRQVQ